MFTTLLRVLDGNNAGSRRLPRQFWLGLAIPDIVDVSGRRRAGMVADFHSAGWACGPSPFWRGTVLVGRPTYTLWKRLHAHAAIGTDHPPLHRHRGQAPALGAPAPTDGRRLIRHDAPAHGDRGARRPRLRDDRRRLLRRLRPDPADALPPPSTAQRALAAEPGASPSFPSAFAWPCTPAAAQARDRDYFGPPVNRVARLLATGLRRQVLLSQATATSSATARQRCLLGPRRTPPQGPAEPEQIFQVADAGLGQSSRARGPGTASHTAQPAAAQTTRPRGARGGGWPPRMRHLLAEGGGAGW